MTDTSLRGKTEGTESGENTDESFDLVAPPRARFRHT